MMQLTALVAEKVDGERGGRCLLRGDRASPSEALALNSAQGELTPLEIGPI